MTNVLGIHGFSATSKQHLHDTGAAIIKDGEVIAAVNEERMTRIKTDGSFPFETIKTIFEITNLTPKDIDYIAFSDERPLWQLLNIGKYILKTYKKSGVFLYKYILESIERSMDINREPPNNLKNKPIVFVEHHKAHASSAFFTSPWKRATIITLDGMGDYCIGGTVGLGSNGGIKILKRTNGFFSPGIFYMIVTSYLGFKPGRHEGKVTGLAAYGDPNKAYSSMKRIISYDDASLDFYSEIIPTALNRFSLTKNESYTLELFEKLWDGYDKADIAAAAQKRLEDIVLPFIRDAVRITAEPKLAVAGGVFANVKLNKMIMELPEVENIYVHPNMGDGGLATGAALFCWNQISKNRENKTRFMKTCYLGPKYGEVSIKNALKKADLKWKKIAEPEKSIANYIAEGHIVGHYYGRMEYGPRALGNRSILASPTDPLLNKRLNERLKRTEFMPFAPSILEEYAHEYLKDWKTNHFASRFMTICYDVKDIFKKKAPAAVHIDGTARPQIVRANDNPRFYKIIKEFYKITGIPLVVNTSFNMHEEPIICTPEDAIRDFMWNSIDILFIDNYALVNKNITV